MQIPKLEPSCNDTIYTLWPIVRPHVTGLIYHFMIIVIIHYSIVFNVLTSGRGKFPNPVRVAHVCLELSLIAASKSRGRTTRGLAAPVVAGELGDLTCRIRRPNTKAHAADIGNLQYSNDSLRETSHTSNAQG